MALGKNVEALRRRNGWTMEDLSVRSGVEVGTINALEKRDSKRSQYATALARAFGLSVEELESGAAASPSALPEPSNVSAAPEPTVADLLERLRAEIATQPEAVKRAIAELMGEYVTTPDESTGRAVADAILRILGPRP